MKEGLNSSMKIVILRLLFIIMFMILTRMHAVAGEL